MNTIRSVGYGWGVLIVAGAGSYYFAKRSVNADRAERAAAEEQRRQHRERMRVEEMISRNTAKPESTSTKRREVPVNNSDNPSPSRQASTGDSEPTQHATAARSPYEAADPFRSRKGDRFS